MLLIFFSRERLSKIVFQLPLGELNQNWLKNYRPSLKRDAKARPESISIDNFLQNNASTLNFLESSQSTN